MGDMEGVVGCVSGSGELVSGCEEGWSHVESRVPWRGRLIMLLVVEIGRERWDF